jgi:hypothetical protein
MRERFPRYEIAPSILEVPLHIHAARIEALEYENKSNHSAFYIDSLFDQVNQYSSDHSKEQIFMLIDQLNLENLSCMSLTAILKRLGLYENTNVFNKVFDYTMEYIVKLGNDPRDVLTNNGITRK